MRRLGRLFSFVLPYWGYALLNLFFNLLSAFFSVFSLTMVIPFLQILFQKEHQVTEAPVFSFSKEAMMGYLDYWVNQFIISEGKFHTLFYLCLFVVVLFLLKNLFQYLALYFLAPIRTGVIRDLRSKLYEHLLILPLSFYSEKRRGDLITRATGDIQEVEASIMRSFELFFREPLTIILYLITLFILSTYLSVFVLVMLPLAGWIIGRLARRLRKKSIESQRKMGQLMSQVEETVAGLRILKAFNALDVASVKFREMNQHYTRLMIGIGRKGDLSSPLSEFLGILILMVILVVGGYMVLNREISLGAEAFIGFIVIFSQLINPAKNISTAFAQVQRGISSLERIQEVLDSEEVIVEKEHAASIKEFKNFLELKQVSFSYGKEMVLHELDLRIDKGKVIALVGPSGSGKSTLVDLLPRFIDPTSGSIELDGIPLEDYVISQVRSLFGIVTQEPILFNDTVFNNISFGKEDATLEEVMEAAKKANAHGFIGNLPNGYDSLIGERGGKLSGGQRQRLSIARAILNNPPILILDEATSSLDLESEQQVQQGIDLAMKGRTTVVIAHRFATILRADLILVLDKGRFVEKGSHQELMEIPEGTYKKMYDIQSFV